MKHRNPTLLAVIAALALPACYPKAPPASIITMSPEPLTTMLVGDGRIASAPEYIELTVQVSSQCYDTPAAASAAADQATAKVFELLKAATDSSSSADGVVSRGGLTSTFQRYGSSNRILCEGTFQKQATVIMKSSRIADFPRDYTKIQREILSGTLSQPKSTSKESPVTFATLHAPVPRLTHKTRDRIEQEALATAMENARAKFAATRKVACPETGHKIVKFVERSFSNGPRPYERVASTESSATIDFGEIWVDKALEVHFALADGCEG